jgi:hypothetical protein
MNKKTLLYIALLTAVLSVGMLQSCYYDNESYLYNSGSCNDTTYTFNGRIKAIVDQNCATAGCHTGASPEAGIALNTYTAVKDNAENGEFFCSINWNSGCSQMPKNSNKLDACNILALQQWKEKGYPEN